jgi:transposase
LVLCELARTDAHRFRLLEPDSDQTKALRALTRSREDLVAARVALANQLGAELKRFWPGSIRLLTALDRPISLAFLARYPSPDDTHGLGEKRMAAFLKAHRYARKTPTLLLERLRSAPSGRAGEIETRTRRAIVIRLVSTLQVLVEQIQGLETEIGQALDAHPDGEIFRSFFKTDSVICAATLLAEIGDCRRRWPHRDAIAADAGQAPVAVESGKRKHAKFRWACNKRLRNALCTLAHCSCRWNVWAADRYANARKRGHNHRRALRTLGRASARIIWRRGQTRTPYDPARHTALQHHILVTIPGASDPRPDLPATHRMAAPTTNH